MVNVLFTYNINSVRNICAGRDDEKENSKGKLKVMKKDLLAAGLSCVTALCLVSPLCV